MEKFSFFSACNYLSFVDHLQESTSSTVLKAASIKRQAIDERGHTNLVLSE